MSTWQVLFLFALTACAIGCLMGIFKAIEKLSNAIFSIRTELVKLNSKLEAIEVNQSDPSFDSAIRDLEKFANRPV